MEVIFILGDIMAVFSKKLRLKKNGILNEEVYNIYSTIDEVKPEYIEVFVDGRTGYVPMTKDTHDFAGSIKIGVNSTNYSLITKASQVYNYKIFNEPGIYTFTVPEYVLNVRVTLIGGGGGAGCSGRGSGSYHNDAIGGNGGESKFGSLSVGGGGGGKAWCYHETYTDEWGDPYTVEYTYGHSAGVAGSPGGRAGVRGGDNSAVSGGAGFQLLDNKTYGTGGACGAPNNTKRYWDLMGSGGSGGYLQTIVKVTPLSTISVVVGGGGVGDNNNRESTSYAKDGDGGAVQIEWGEGIG